MRIEYDSARGDGGRYVDLEVEQGGQSPHLPSDGTSCVLRRAAH